MSVHVFCEECGSIGPEHNHNISIDYSPEIARLQAENKTLREALYPHEGIKDCYPLILYFATRQEADEFVNLVQQVKPMRSYRI